MTLVYKMIVFDWDKAAMLIGMRKPEIATAGILEWWTWSSGAIYENGRPVPRDNTYTYLATADTFRPTLILDGEACLCYIDGTEAIRRWGDGGWSFFANLYWPDSALAILHAESAVEINENGEITTHYVPSL